MPTREEIVSALRCTGERACAGCAYNSSPYCVIESGRDAAALIEQQAEEIELLKRQRDAAVKDLAIANKCEISEVFRWRRLGGRR